MQVPLQFLRQTVTRSFVFLRQTVTVRAHEHNQKQAEPCGGRAVRTVSRPFPSGFCTRNEQELTTGLGSVTWMNHPSPWSSSLISTLVPVPVPNPRRLAPLQYHGLHLHAHGGLVVVEMDLSLSAHLSSIARRRTNIAPDVNPFCWLVCA